MHGIAELECVVGDEPETDEQQRVIVPGQTGNDERKQSEMEQDVSSVFRRELSVPRYS